MSEYLWRGLCALGHAVLVVCGVVFALCRFGWRGTVLLAQLSHEHAACDVSVSLHSRYFVCNTHQTITPLGGVNTFSP